MIIALKRQCWKGETKPTLDSVGLWVNAKSGGEWTSPIWLSKLATWNFFTTYTHTFIQHLQPSSTLRCRTIHRLENFLVNYSCTSNWFEIFLVIFLKCIETNVVKYSYLHSSSRSEVVNPNFHALNSGDCTDWPLATWDLEHLHPWAERQTLKMCFEGLQACTKFF